MKATLFPFCILTTALLLTPPPARADGAATEESDQAVLARASAAFAAGARAAAKDPGSARPALAPAIADYERLINERGHHSAALHYNLGNALYLSNDLGRAMLAYRRAQRLDPGLPGLNANLAAARSKIGFKPSSGANPAGAVGETVTWHTLIPASVRLWFAAGTFGACWLTLLARLPRGEAVPRPPKWLAGAFAAFALLAGGSVWWQNRAERATPPGVIIEDRVVGRKGPDELGYEPSFTEPLRAGFEVSVLERRGEWISVQLADGRSTWVPASSVETVQD